MASKKLVVEVVRAEGLSAANCTGVFVELRFQGEKQSTSTSNDTISPEWKDRLSFDVSDSDPEKLADLSLDAEVYSVDERSSSRRFTLGKVRVQGTRFVPLDEAVRDAYNLKKRGMLSWGGNGKLVLYIFLQDVNDSNDSTTGNAAADSSTANNVRTQQVTRDGQISVPRGWGQQLPTRPDFAVRSISPSLGGGRIVDGRLSRVGRKAKDHVPSHDLVEVMWYIFVSVVKGRNLPAVSSTGSIDPYIEVIFGNYNAKTQHRQSEHDPQWGVVFAFSNEYMQSSKVEVVLKSRDAVRDDFVGMVPFDLENVPTRVPPESALAARWYKLMDRRMQTANGELMLSVWKGTQADEAFHDAWHSDSATPVHPSPITSELRSKVYSAPVLWCLKLDALRAVVLTRAGNPRLAVYLKAQIGTSQILRTRPVDTSNCSWGDGETLRFLVAEPFEESLVLSFQNRQGPNSDETVGSVVIPIASIDKRTDSREISPQWFPLQKSDGPNGNKPSAKVYLRLSLEGGYSVPVDSPNYRSDLRSTVDQHLCSSQTIGSLELGIIRAEALLPMKTKDGRATVDSYCVTKYGGKWVRTRTILDSQSPTFNEQYEWDVYDPCTVLTIGVFDNCHVAINTPDSLRDTRIGKVRIRLSTLEAGRVYALSYPILVLIPSGVKKMGELQVTVRFSYTSLLSMPRAYLRPLLPVMHYTVPISGMQADSLHYRSTLVTAIRLGQQEPPLRKEAVEYICDDDSLMFSMRKVKSLFSRFLAVCSTFIAAYQLYLDIAMWKDHYLTVLCHVLFIVGLCFPHLLLPMVPFCLCLLMLWNRRCRPRLPEHLDTSISCAENAHPDELDEEFDTFPTSRSPDLVRMRYDRMRSVAGRLQTLAAGCVVQMERVEALLRWRDPRATTMFTLLCLVAAVALFIAPRVVALAAGLYVMRHPRFRGDTPSAFLNLFSRLPSKQDCLM